MYWILTKTSTVARIDPMKSTNATTYRGRPCRHGHGTKRNIKSGKCVRCMIDRANRQRREADPVELRMYNRAAKRKGRGTPEPTRPEPLNCEACDAPPNGSGSLHLDHDHTTGKFRGWLCSRCNTAIGKLGDNVAGVRRALAYLARSV